MADDRDEVNWSAVIARCLAYLALKNSRYADKSLLEQAEFLEKLGLPLEDRAAIVGSTARSLRELSRQARARKGARPMPKPSAESEVEARPDNLTAFESKLVNLLALILVQERKQPEQISLLSRAGFRPIEIASVLGTTSNTVSVQLSLQKRARKVASSRRAKK